MSKSLKKRLKGVAGRRGGELLKKDEGKGMCEADRFRMTTADAKTKSVIAVFQPARKSRAKGGEIPRSHKWGKKDDRD